MPTSLPIWGKTGYLQARKPLIATRISSRRHQRGRSAAPPRPATGRIKVRRMRRLRPARGQEGVLHHHCLLLDVEVGEIEAGREVVGVGPGAVAGPKLRQDQRDSV